MQRDPRLDSLRGIAALAVLLYHALIVMDVFLPFNPGLFGVCVFFMISGLIMPATIARAPSLASFFRARVRRLWPAYLVAFVSAASLQYAQLVPPNWAVPWPDAPGMVANALMLPSVGGVQGLLPVAWTLELEWLFYATLALLWARSRMDLAPLISALAMLLYLISPSPLSIGIALFFLGVTATERPRLAMVLGLALCLCGAPEVLFSLAIVALRRRLWPGAAGLGRISYGVYLVHLPLLWVLPVPIAVLLVLPLA